MTNSLINEHDLYRRKIQANLINPTNDEIILFHSDYVDFRWNYEKQFHFEHKLWKIENV